MKYQLSFRWQTALILILIGGAAFARLIPHIPNATPLAAIALIGGAMLARPWSFVVPVAALIASDAVIGFYQWQIMATVYGSFLVIVLFGEWIKKQRTAKRIVSASIAGSILFYLITNAAVWKFSGMYPQTLDGLLASYYLALPFFRNTLFGDLMYASGFFLAAEYAPALVARMLPGKIVTPAPVLPSNK